MDKGRLEETPREAINPAQEVTSLALCHRQEHQAHFNGAYFSNPYHISLGLCGYLEHQEAPKSWRAASGSASKLYYQEMITFFPELGYCDGNWKCDSNAIASYTSRCRNHISRLIHEGTYKPTVDDMIDFDNLETLDADDINNATDNTKIRKQTHDSQADPLLCTVSTSTKKRKPSEISGLSGTSMV
ncbi:hypothetical protein P692DRAFT_201811454 [Suillus brevipes Sb2]|nr:hypothetical protein P692DRAFT_201811454 [Suillus brevipes Sb2]